MARLIKFWLVAVTLSVAAMGAAADRAWLTVHLGSERIGYAWYETVLPRSAGTIEEAEVVLDTKALGDPIKLRAFSRVRYGGDRELMTGEYRTESGGRTSTVQIEREGSTLVVKANSAGRPQQMRLELAPDLPFTSDAVNYLIALKERPERLKVQTFDSTTLTMVQVEVIDRGPVTLEDGGRTMPAHRYDVEDPRSPTQVFVSPEGKFLLSRGPLGMTMRPATEEEAKRPVTGGPSDIADLSTIVPNKPLQGRPDQPLTLRFVGLDRDLPSDKHQTATREGRDVVLTIHPLRLAGRLPLAEVKGQDEWRGPAPFLPSQNEVIKHRARIAMGSLTDVHEIAQALRMDVYRRMRVNAGIGVLRPADEILDAPEGVCRDHAILLATMLRAVGYASRLVSGMVEYQGRFYYHAWVEYWDGKDWIAMDSTRPESQLTSRHIKIAHGSVADAYQSFLLAPERLEVVKEGA